MDAIVEYGSDSIARGSRSFSAAAKLFPAAVRDDAVMLYAWCRHCDDAIDGQTAGHRRPEAAPHDSHGALAALVEQTDRAVAGDPPDDPVFQALARVVGRHGIPRRHPMDLLRGFAMDVEGRHYETIEETLEYCYHVAGVVGVMMAMIMGVRDPAVLRRATDLGLAFQLTNIARDVADDAAMGRVYLPAAWLRAEGVEPDALTDAANAAAVSRVVNRLLDAAEPYYASARVGLRHLPFRSAWAIATARGVYRDIGREVRALGPDAMRRRASTGRMRKFLWIARGCLQAVGARTVERLLADPPRGALWTRANVQED